MSSVTSREVNSASLSESQKSVCRHPTPFSLHPLILLLTSFFIIALTSKFIGNGDAVQRLLYNTNAYSRIVDSIPLRETLIKTVAGVGMSSTVLTGMIAGFYLRIVGPKICVLSGILCNAFGIIFLFILKLERFYFLGAVLMGCGYQLIVNGHFSLLVLFPKNQALVLAILG